jgi:hypothetical protein
VLKQFMTADVRVFFHLEERERTGQHRGFTKRRRSSPSSVELRYRNAN